MATVEELQRQLNEMKEKTKMFVTKMKEEHTTEISSLKQQNQQYQVSKKCHSIILKYHI